MVLTTEEATMTIADYVQRYGNSNSISIFDPTCKVFKIPEVDGILGYRMNYGTAVVFGDPVCKEEDKIILAKAFHKYCQENNWEELYITASKDFMNWAVQEVAQTVIKIGYELVFNPQDPKVHCETAKGQDGRTLRNKVSHARRFGVTVHEYIETEADPELKRKINEAGATWLKNRKGPQIYVAQVDLFIEKVGRRWFYAVQNDTGEQQVIGVLLLNRLDARDGYLFNLLMATPDAPHGTTELLAVSALKALKNEGCTYVTVGVLPIGSAEVLQGFSSLSRQLVNVVFKIAKHFFKLDARYMYWKKFQPTTAEESYLLLSQPNMSIRLVRGVMSAFNASVV